LRPFILALFAWISHIILDSSVLDVECPRCAEIEVLQQFYVCGVGLLETYRHPLFTFSNATELSRGHCHQLPQPIIIEIHWASQPNRRKQKQAQTGVVNHGDHSSTRIVA
jgi:hypothetical protein